MGVEIAAGKYFGGDFLSCPARGMGVEMDICSSSWLYASVMPREGHGSRNSENQIPSVQCHPVMPREGHGSRNDAYTTYANLSEVMPREGHGSRNLNKEAEREKRLKSCPARGMGVEIGIRQSPI